MLTILDNAIGMVDGRYSLNDLHKASGGLKKHQPTNFIRNKQTQEIINELKTEYSRYSNMRSLEPIRVVEGIQADGTPQGTYVSRELVYAYAMWISPRFQILVIRAFDAVTTQRLQLDKHLDNLCRDLTTVTTGLTIAGRYLCVNGKQVKPQIESEIEQVLNQMQLSLKFNTDNNAYIDIQGG